MSLISIIPRLPPAIDGVGDYALSLARQLREDFGIQTHFIIGDPAWSGAASVNTFPVSRVAERSAANLLSSLLSCPEPASGLLLHYVGYGYAKRGAPGWLVDGLENWRASYCDLPLITMFHEVYAKGPFWTSSFWLASRQKSLASRLARMSAACLTSRQGYAQILREVSGNKQRLITTLPVFSNIGEPEQTPLPLKDRQRRIIVFGARGSRLRVYEKSLASLERACRALAIEEIFDVGPPINSLVSQVNGVPVVQTGHRPAAEISALLSDSVAGFFDYHTAFLAKSTIFAAYSAHGLIPVSAACEAVQADGLKAGTHYWIADPHEKTLSLTDGQEIADNASAWYQTHKLSEHVKILAEVIGHIQKPEFSLN